MPVAKGAPWGQPGALPSDGVVVANDAEARAVLESARLDRRPFPPLGLAGGDLCETLGGGADPSRLHTEQAMTFRVDLGEVLVDGRMYLFVAHVLARTSMWGAVFAAMNAQRRRAWIVAPRAHPGDGLLDVYDARLSPAARVQVRGRLRHGTHLPHPAITERRVPAVQVSFARARRVELDGVAVGSSQALSVRVQPDAVVVVV